MELEVELPRHQAGRLSTVRYGLSNFIMVLFRDLIYEIELIHAEQGPRHPEVFDMMDINKEICHLIFIFLGVDVLK